LRKNLQHQVDGLNEETFRSSSTRKVEAISKTEEDGTGNRSLAVAAFMSEILAIRIKNPDRRERSKTALLFGSIEGYCIC